MLDIIPKEQVYVAAPTGKAANNIGGSTLHSLLHLMNPEEMKGQQLKMMQNKFKNIRYLIIDEYSMVGAYSNSSNGFYTSIAFYIIHQASVLFYM